MAGAVPGMKDKLQAHHAIIIQYYIYKDTIVSGY